MSNASCFRCFVLLLSNWFSFRYVQLPFPCTSFALNLLFVFFLYIFISQATLSICMLRIWPVITPMIACCFSLRTLQTSPNDHWFAITGLLGTKRIFLDPLPSSAVPLHVMNLFCLNNPAPLVNGCQLSAKQKCVVLLILVSVFLLFSLCDHSSSFSVPLCHHTSRLLTCLALLNA